MQFLAKPEQWWVMLSRGASDLGRLSSARVGLWRQELSNSSPGGDNVCNDEEEECSVLMQMVFFWFGGFLF